MIRVLSCPQCRVMLAGSGPSGSMDPIEQAALKDLYQQCRLLTESNSFSGYGGLLPWSSLIDNATLPFCAPHNRLYGTWCVAGHVVSLDLHSVNMQGPLPNSLIHLSALSILSIAKNPRFSLTAWPCELRNLTQLEIFRLEDCGSLNGFGIPDACLDGLTSLRHLTIHGARFTGPFPHSIIHLVNLQVCER